MDTNVERQQKNPVHGSIYQAKILMLFQYRGLIHKYSFRLGTEIEEAQKFDDVVFEYINDGKTEYRLLQAKHRLDESKKISADNLLTESDSPYSLIKYFFSYQDAKKLFKSGYIKDVIIFTNIDLNVDQLQNKIINVEEIKNGDNILNVESKSCKKPIRYRFNEDIIPLLKPKLQNYNITRLARRLAECFLENNLLQHKQANDIFKFFHVVLANDVIDVKNKQFHYKFIKNENLSEDAENFRNIFMEKIQKCSEGKLSFEKINEDIANKKKINNKKVGLILAKGFGEGEDKSWQNDSISDDEIKDFLNHLVLAVNQPNEEELGELIKNEMGKELDLDIVTRDNMYNKFYVVTLDWLQGKKGKRFVTNREVCQLFETAKIVMPIMFNVQEPIESFTGRDKELKELHTILQKKSQTVISHAASISGLGGIGKSELARKYISKYSNEYDNQILWINAESYETLTRSFLSLAQDKLKISAKNIDGNEKCIGSIIDDVYRFFGNGKCLFIFDNAEKLKNKYEKDEGINKFITSPPNVRKPYFLITSRNQQWGSIEVLSLSTFTSKEAAEFIQKALNVKDDSQEDDILKLAEKLQNFPLALQQAVAYIKERDAALMNTGSKFYINDYLIRYDKETEKLLNFEFPDDSSDLYARTTFTTWKITTEKLINGEYGKQVIEILNIISYFAPNDIPTELFLGLELVNGDQETLGEAIQQLKKYSMVDSGTSKCSLNIHRLVQQVTRINSKKENIEEEIIRKALILFKFTADSSNVDHVLSAWNYAINYPELVKEFCSLASNSILELKNCIRYKEAYTFGFKTLEVLKSLNNYDNDMVRSVIVVLMENLAIISGMQGKYDESLQNLKQILDIKIKYLKSNNPTILKTKRNMALIFHKNSDYNNALGYYQEIYDTRKNSSGEKDPETLSANVDIATVLLSLEKYDEAVKILLKVLNDQKSLDVLGEDHLETVKTKHTLVNAYIMQDKLEEALKLSNEVYEKRKALLGSDHPDTLSSQNNIAVILCRQDKFDEALKIYEDVYEIRERKFGPDDPDTLNTKMSVALLFKSKSKYDLALKSIQDIFKKIKYVLGSEHPLTLTAQHEMGLILENNGECNKALDTFQDVYNKRKEKLGPSHPDTLKTSNCIAERLCRKGEYDLAYKTYQEMLIHQRKNLGENHTDVLTTKTNMANVLSKLRNYNESMQYYQEVYEAYIVIDENHPGAFMSKNNIALAFADQGKYNDAFRIFKEVITDVKATLGETHLVTLTIQRNRAQIYLKIGKHQKALKIFRKLLSIQERPDVLGKNDPQTLTLKCDMASAVAAHGGCDEALKIFQGVLDIQIDTLGEHHPDTLRTKTYIAGMLMLQNGMLMLQKFSPYF